MTTRTEQKHQSTIFAAQFNQLMLEIEDQSEEQVWREDDDMYVLRDGSVLVISANYAGKPGAFFYTSLEEYNRVYDPDVIGRSANVQPLLGREHSETV